MSLHLKHLNLEAWNHRQCRLSWLTKKPSWLAKVWKRSFDANNRMELAFTHLPKDRRHLSLVTPFTMLVIVSADILWTWLFMSHFRSLLLAWTHRNQRLPTNSELYLRVAVLEWCSHCNAVATTEAIIGSHNEDDWWYADDEDLREFTVVNAPDVRSWKWDGGRYLEELNMPRNNLSRRPGFFVTTVDFIVRTWWRTQKAMQVSNSTLESYMTVKSGKTMLDAGRQHRIVLAVDRSERHSFIRKSWTMEIRWENLLAWSLLHFWPPLKVWLVLMEVAAIPKSTLSLGLTIQFFAFQGNSRHLSMIDQKDTMWESFRTHFHPLATGANYIRDSCLQLYLENRATHQNLSVVGQD